MEGCPPGYRAAKHTVSKRRERKERRRLWPDPPASGKDVVLHTRVVTETGGGPDKTILLSASHLADTNYWLAAAYMHPPDDAGYAAIEQKARDYGSPLISVPDRGALDRSVLREMLAICRRYKVRIWHGHDYKSNLLGLTLRPFHAMKLVSTVHGWVKHTTRTPLYYTVDRWCLPYYHHVISVSDDLHERVKELGLPDERCTMVQNAIDERQFSRHYPASESPLRQQHGTPKGRLVIGAVGRLSPEKAFNHLIRATHQLVQQGCDVELWIAGDGDHRGELEQIIAHLNMKDRVRLLGFVANTVDLYHAMDLFVLSSLREGLPNVVLEAMAMRVPVVSTRVAGVPKLIVDGESGLLVPIADVQALADAMRRVVTDEASRHSLADGGRKVIERDFTFTRRMAKVRAIYDKVLQLDSASVPQPASIVPKT